MNANKKKILLVEDEAIIALSETDSLKKYGFDVINATNAEKAIELAKADSAIDLILMDIDLGKGMDGTQAAEIILEDNDIPVVFLSSHAEKEIVDKTKRITNYGFIVKHSGETVLAACIEMAFKLHDAYRETKYSEERYQVLFENAAEGIMIYDRDLVIRNVNHRSCEIVGYDKSELMGKNILNIGILHPDDYPLAYQNALSLLRGEPVGRTRYHFIHKTGNILLCDLNGASIRDKTGAIVSVISIVLDVTEQNRAEEALAISERNYREIFNASNEAIFVHDLDGKILDVNKTMCEMYGFTPDETRALTVSDISQGEHPYSQEEAEKLIRKAIEEGSSNFEWLCRKKSGELFWAEVSLKRLIISGQERVLAFVRDISEKKQSGAALQESEKLLQRIFDQSLIGIAVLSPDYHFIRVNAELCRILGYSEEEMGLKRFPDVTHPANITDDVVQVRRLSSGEIDRYIVDKRYIRKDGMEVWGHAIIQAIKNELNQSVFFLALISDMTERKQMEESLVKSVEEKEILMKELQHRVKNNLNIISSLINLQKDRLSDDGSKKIFAALQAHIKSISRIYEQLSRSDRQDNVDLKLYINSVADSLFKIYDMAADSIRLTTRLDEVQLDSKRAVPLGLIMNELLSNALQHAYAPGTRGEIRIDLGMSGGTVTLKVSDDGVGLPDGFDRDTADSLGLKLIKLLARQIDAELSIEAGKGTAISISFPFSNSLPK